MTDWATAAESADMSLNRNVRVLIWTAPKSRWVRARLAWRLWRGIDRVGQFAIYYGDEQRPEHIALVGVQVEYGNDNRQ